MCSDSLHAMQGDVFDRLPVRWKALQKFSRQLLHRLEQHSATAGSSRRRLHGILASTKCHSVEYYWSLAEGNISSICENPRLGA